MSDADRKTPSDEPTPKLPATTESFERYDLTGNRIRRWSVAARNKLMATSRKLFRFGKAASETQLPGNDETLGEKSKKLPGKGVDFFEAQIDKAPIDNQLKTAQTQTEFLKQELLREQIANTREDTRTKKLSNAARELELRERLGQITKGKTDIHTITDGDNESIVVGSVPDLLGYTSISDDQNVSELELPSRIANCLLSNGISNVSDIVILGRNGLMDIEGIGKKSLAEIEAALASLGVALEH